MIARMWEARVASGRLDEAVEWLRRTVAPAARAAGCVGVEVFRSAVEPPRAVLITRWPDPAAAASYDEGTHPSLDRAHSWLFETVD